MSEVCVAQVTFITRASGWDPAGIRGQQDGKEGSHKNEN